eukprot:GEMP01020571.1.p1 GENE.GEMP01020571.1~~GEMP01020571.1.p1  ORF type:complete len:187 (+),score=48.94 GEMP01020571.1:138-698(+)
MMQNRHSRLPTPAGAKTITTNTAHARQIPSPNNPVPEEAYNGDGTSTFVGQQQSTSQSSDGTAPSMHSRYEDSHVHTFDGYMENVADDTTAKQKEFSEYEENVENRNNEEWGRRHPHQRRSAIVPTTTSLVWSKGTKDFLASAGPPEETMTNPVLYVSVATHRQWNEAGQRKIWGGCGGESNHAAP